MTDDILKERRRALEQVFHERDQKLLDQIRSTLEFEKVRQDQVRRLREVSGISDTSVLDLLVQLNVAPETFAAMALVPLIRVAWADNRVEGKEREAVLQAASEQGITEGSDARRLLERWLERPPATPQFTEAWMSYMRTLLENVSDEGRQQLKSSILDRATRVAEATGGILGFGSISKSEQAVIDELSQAFGA